MPTLRDSIQNEISSIEARLSAKKARLVELETGLPGLLDREVEEVKTLFRAIGSHLFSGPAEVPPPVAPAAPAAAPLA